MGWAQRNKVGKRSCIDAPTIKSKAVRQEERATLRMEALAAMPAFIEARTIPRRTRRLMARVAGNRAYRQKRGLPEPKNAMRRGGLRK